MTDIWRRSRRQFTRRRTLVGLVSVMAVAALIAAACGEEATPTPIPQATATPVPQPTATPVPGATATPAPGATATPAPGATATPAPQPTATPAPTTGLRPRSEWTAENPATRAEIEAELEKYRGETFVFASWGGAYQAAQRQAYLVPFQAQFGIEVIEESPMDYAKTRAMAETGNILWHVVDMGGQASWQLGLGGTLEELDPSVVDIRDWPETMKSPWFGGAGITWSNVLAYNTDTYPQGLSTMSEVFDVDRVPGRRGLAGPEWSWKTSLRFALLSEHPDWIKDSTRRRELSRLTEAEIDEAFAILKEFKPNVSVWWVTGSDCPQLLISGELDMCTAWNGRIFDAQKQGVPMKICWECGHLMNTGAWGIVKGLKAQDPATFELAQLFTAWATFPEIMVEQSQYISYGPLILTGVPLLDDPKFADVVSELPSSPANVPFGIIEDERWGGEQADRMGERWVAFVQS